MAESVSFGYRQVTPAEKKRLVREHFDPIARTYDRADRFLSFGLDARWRREAVGLLDLVPGDLVLDVCGGTGGLAKLAAPQVRPGGRVVVCDFNRPMLRAGRDAPARHEAARAIDFVQGDGEELGFPDATFDAVTMGLGLRNLARPEQGLRESFRVLAPGGMLAVFEFSVPRNRLLAGLHRFYSFRCMPLLGRLVCGTAAPFQYLAESVRVFPGPESVAGMIRRAGFSDVRFIRRFDGLAVIYLGVKPASTDGRKPGRSGA